MFNQLHEMSNDGKFLPGNKMWEKRVNVGRKKIFDDPETLSDAAVQYFEWNENNPLIAYETVKYQGDASLVEVPKMRAMSITGFCLFCGISIQTFYDYKARTDFTETVTRIEKTIYNQKFEGAAAELLNPSFIGKDLGLTDEKRIEIKTFSLDDVDLSQFTTDELRVFESVAGKIQKQKTSE